MTSDRGFLDGCSAAAPHWQAEALVGTHPLLEEFKLLHRALDVKKVQAEVRLAELENIRLAARALEGERGDPEIDKRIVIDGAGATVALNPDE